MKVKRKAHGAIDWTPEVLAFIRDNYEKMSNKELAEALGMHVQSLRNKLYSLGYRRMKLEYWTKEQIRFLKENYKTKGDTELADIFEIRWYKEKSWTVKHIEKKRKQLKLKRTKSELAAIRKRNAQMGAWKEVARRMRARWKKHPAAKIGTQRIWFAANDLPYVVIKTRKGMVPYARYLWEKENGKIPKGMNVVVTGPDRLDFTIKDLTLMTDSELARHNHKRRIPKELKETQELLRKLQRKIQDYEHH